ncbi:helix-turn-helix transcriptional regulator [Halorubrum sp. JWXQ-INN 858]|uniref:helix-turn-helix transcriptional regulator n=1 Tax=Halorubrum sp. JWXQ-INN 858 TaxID=2690782 RepID=UPI00190F5D70|nr:helix-turn-helix transcriptional regulator [Halorubrum sp. JWXQ-INN 858]
MTDPTETAGVNGGHRLNQLFEVLSHPFRRQVLFYLCEHTPDSEGELTVGALKTGGDDPDVLTIQLRHLHFPKLANAGYIEWEESTDTVRRGPMFDEVEPFLRLMHDHRDELPGVGPRTV